MQQDKHPLVAIKCLVFNHEPYLRDCLNGFVMQQTDFPFVAIVHDDASTDHSADIIREYAAKYPDIIRPIYETENQYSKPDGSLGRIMNAAVDATGAKYIAVCEGDDYWTDPRKLQKQVDFLESHPDYSMCFHGAEILNTIGITPSIHCTDIEDRDYCATEVFERWVVPTASIVYRKENVEAYPIKHKEWILYGDIILVEKCCHVGKIRGFSDSMSVYRMQGDSMIHSPRYKAIKLQKAPLGFKCIYLNFNKIDKNTIRWCISQAYYSRSKVSTRPIVKRIWDICCSFYWMPNIMLSKVKNKLVCSKH